MLLEYENYLSKEYFYKMIDDKRMILNDKKQELKSNYMKFSLFHKNEIKENISVLKLAYEHFLKNHRDKVMSEIRLLDNISPLKVLQRGYSVVSNPDGVITSSKQVQVNDVIRIRLNDGKIYASVTRKDDSNE